MTENQERRLPKVDPKRTINYRQDGIDQSKYKSWLEALIDTLAQRKP